jgi:SH3 domain-containing YSC84-like protein 1
MNKEIGLIAFSALLLANGEGAREQTARRLEESATVLAQSVSGIPKDVLQNAYCIAIVPCVNKDSSVVGGHCEQGFICCRSRRGEGWSAPGTVRIDGNSSDVIVLAMNQLGTRRLLSARSALAPEGVELRSWSRTRGVFAEAILKGFILREDLAGNEALYGQRLKNGEITMKNLGLPPRARKLLSTLSEIGSDTQRSKCDLNRDGEVNNLDVQIELKQLLGIVPCTNGDLDGDGSCSAVDLQRIINATRGQVCRVGR